MAVVSIYPIWKNHRHTGRPRRRENNRCPCRCRRPERPRRWQDKRQAVFEGVRTREKQSCAG